MKIFKVCEYVQLVQLEAAVPICVPTNSVCEFQKFPHVPSFGLISPFHVSLSSEYMWYPPNILL